MLLFVINIFLIFFSIIIIIILLEIPPFVKDLNFNKEFNIIEKRIIKNNADYDNLVFIDQKIEENRFIYNMFYFIIVSLD
jgi:hypothetical protein